MSIFFSFLFSGCFSIKPTSVKSGKKYYESFYVGEEGVQYFIKPLLFENKEAKEELLADFTFRVKEGLKDSATLNFSIYGSQIYKNIVRVKISSSDYNTFCDQVKFMFNEKEKKAYISRFSCRMPLAELNRVFANNDITFTLIFPEGERSYVPSKKTKKVVELIRNNIFDIISN